MKALVVDDSMVMRKLIIKELLDIGFKEQDIVQASDGLQAVAAAQEQEFRIILMDWNMPNMLGIDALKTIRNSGNKVPVLMVTTEGERIRVVEAIQAGASNYLVKPFTKEDFAGKVVQLLGGVPNAV